MPHLTFRGLRKKELLKISGALAESLAKAIGCEKSIIALDHLKVTTVLDGEEIRGQPFVEVVWFDRGQAVRDAVAALIAEHLAPFGYDEVDVWFTAPPRDSYYTNGKHY